ncbi:ABC transporter substrate-binding protein (plasmid) [Skermanella sp. TT6]|uniref:ABC transporter substrate-binding protein n=1 Tax=Skermanella cutis TaxID=2775420 RepID=A0ABX7BH30_9PROT|nr:ABC transporter substrate-binding protein [Skermanella sp. TT6]QQP93080.1 ABC transporter substrate-binding protein [Skermanella sp. TT6]
MFRTSRIAAAALVLATVSVPAWAADTIRVLSPTWPGFAPVFVAADKGYFKELGLTVDMKFEDDRANVMAAMMRGDIEVDMRTVGEHQGRPRDEATPGVIIGTIDKSVGGDGVIADGSIGGVADLRGKKIAVEPNIPARLLLQLALKKEGMSLDDLSIVEIATADTIAVFADSSIAAVGTYQPFQSQAITALPARKGKLLLSSVDSEIIIDVITARQDDLKKNPTKYRNFLAGVYRAIDLYRTNPEEFIELAAPHYNLSEDEVKEIIDTSLAYTPLAEAKDLIGTPDRPGRLHGIFDTVMQLNIENGAADTTLTAASQIDASVISQVSP